MKDCYFSRLVEFAHFDGTMEIPYISRPSEYIIPKGMVPFSQWQNCIDYDYFVCFYEEDDEFFDFLNSPATDHPVIYSQDLEKSA